MFDLKNKRMSRNYKKPSGLFGIYMGNLMNSKSQKLYNYIFSKIEIVDNEKILEIGCGNGKYFSNYFELNSNIEVFGADISNIMLKQSIKNNKELIKQNKLSIIKTNIEDILFKDNYFNKIITINTIYFWTNPVKASKEMYRVLKNGDGKVYIILRTKETLQKIPLTKYNFTYYEYEEIKEFLHIAGFKNINLDYIPNDINHYKSICVSAEKY